jgi:hypothetical protein
MGVILNETLGEHSLQDGPLRHVLNSDRVAPIAADFCSTMGGEACPSQKPQVRSREQTSGMEYSDGSDLRFTDNGHCGLLSK